MADRYKQNVAQQRNPPQKPKSWWISTKAVSNQTTIWHHQPLTRVKWFEPLQAHHLTNLISEHSALEEIHFRKNLKDLNKGHSFPTTRTRPNNQWVWWKHQDADPPTKSWQHPKIVPLTVAPMLLQHKRLTVSNMLLQKRDPPRNSNGSQPLNASVKAWQQHHSGSIWCTSNKQNTAQHRDPLQKQIGWNSQKQLPAPINHLKEEPSAPQSLSIFDSTQTEHKMHNWRRPVVEIVICM
jgi:hypothetical protein